MRRRAMTSAFLVIVGLTSFANAQSPGRVRVTSPYYNGWGQVPGYSVYRNGTYSVDYFGGSKTYHYGYVPASRYRPGRHYNAGNGLMYNPSIYYYEGMHLSPYNVNSPIWGW